MRKGLFRLTVALAVLTSFSLVPAMEEKRKKGFTSSSSKNGGPGIVSATDANGNPLPLQENAVGQPKALNAKPLPVQRGQAWWPYGASQAPYNAVGKRAEAMTEDEIQINGIALLNIRDVDATLRLLPRELKLADGAQLARPDGYFLVKIEGFSRTQEQINELRSAGAVLGEYININTYLAKIPSRSIAAVRALPFVTYVGDYHPAYKISPRIGLEAIPQDEVVDGVTGKMKPWTFVVTLHDGADLDQAIAGLHSIGVFPESHDIVSNFALTFIIVRTTPETVLSIAQLPEVKWISEKPFPKLTASNTSPATIPMQLQNNGVFITDTSTGWKFFNIGLDGNLSGTSQIVTMMDSGLNTNMEHFSQDTSVVGTIGAAHRKVRDYEVLPGTGDQCVTAYNTSDGGHGTWTSQHAVGSISNMTSNPDVTHVPNNFWDPGIARDGRVYFQDIGITGSLFPPADLGTGITAAMGKGSFIQNNSWSASTNSYTADPDPQNLDIALFANPNFVVTVSAGNDGTEGAGSIGHLCTSKNVICVGGVDVAAVNNVFQDCLWDGIAGCGGPDDLGSARGPEASSLRVRPDILGYMANSALVGGEFMAGNRPAAMCQTDAVKNVYWDWQNNNGFGGTSFSSPQVAGLAALVRDYFLAGMYPSGTATPADSITPSGSLVKAVILASGEPTLNVASPTNTEAMATRYSNDAGYGRANLPGVLQIGPGAPRLWVKNNDLLGQAATKSFSFAINGNAIPLRVMLVWYDAVGAAIQKDADLRVTIGASVYRGNVLPAGTSWSATGGSFDRTNNTEGVFLDAAHGLPASGTVQVEVIGFNNPGGMNYSLVVGGNVVSTATQGVSLDKGQYTCAGPINITVTDPLATSPVSVTVTSKNAVSTVIDTEIVSCTGSGGVFNGTILAGGALTVVDGGSITATYATAPAANATIACLATLNDEGFIIGGGCDNTAAGTDFALGPLTNGGVNEFYHQYFDANEYSTYTVGFSNQTGAALSDVYVAVAFSGGGASKMSALNGPIHVGSVAAGATAGAVFQLFTDPSATGLPFPTTVSLDFSITSPGDGYTTPQTFSHTQQLHSNDVIARQNRCSTFNTSLAPWVESIVTGGAANPYRWSGSATTPGTVSSENRTDGMCDDSTANAAAMVGNSAITAGNNFGSGADSTLLQNFQPALTGNGPNGQPYHYVWKWHSFYHASETINATTGVWGVFYNNAWNNPVNPTGDEVGNFPIFLGTSGYFYQTIFDYVGTWNWETANTGIPDDVNASAPPNQLVITFPESVSGLATPTTYFAYGHEHADLRIFGGTSTAATRRDIAFDNDNLVYDEYYTAQQPAACGAGAQLGQPAFDQYAYGSCPSGSAVLSVVDANAGGSVQVTVSSPGTLDTELVTLSLVSGALYSGSITYSTTSGVGNNNGVLFVLPSETLNVSYSDASPLGVSTASAAVTCAGGDVAYVENNQISDNGDNDGIPDTNECVSMDVTIKNNLATQMTNAKVTIFSTSPNVDLITDNQASYGTVASGANATNPPSDRFSFHVAPSVACSDPANPPTATFTVVITADGLDGAALLQTFSLSLDLNVAGGTTNLTQNFTTNPGWTTAVTAPDNGGCATNTYTNDFHWCAACGNAGGGYGAWVGNSAFGTAGQNYTAAYNSSTLYSPVLTAGSTSVTLQFREAGRFETGGTAATLYDGGIVQYQLAGGPWTTLGYTTPAQAATVSGNFCSPILASTLAWTGTTTGTAWTLTNAASVATTSGQKIQFRWRLGGDVSGNGSTYGGFGVDDVTVTGLRAFSCDAAPNTGLGPCTFCTFNANGSACNDANACTAPDVCSAGSCAGAPLTVPPESQNLSASNDKATYSWSATPNSTIYDVVRGSVSLLAVGPGGGDELCFPNLPSPTVSDATTPPLGTANFYLSRGRNLTCPGTYGFQGVNGVPGSPRVTATCP
jgi:hypothetical protein